LGSFFELFGFEIVFELLLLLFLVFVGRFSAFLTHLWMSLSLVAIQTVSVFESFLAKLARNRILDAMHCFIVTSIDPSDDDNFAHGTSDPFTSGAGRTVVVI
jgi:hypothetical protein